MPAVEALGVIAITVMVATYALENRAPAFIAAFAGGCALAALYALLIGSWPFFAAESVWAVIAIRRWRIAARGEACGVRRSGRAGDG